MYGIQVRISNSDFCSLSSNSPNNEINPLLHILQCELPPSVNCAWNWGCSYCLPNFTHLPDFVMLFIFPFPLPSKFLCVNKNTYFHDSLCPFSVLFWTFSYYITKGMGFVWKIQQNLEPFHENEKPLLYNLNQMCLQSLSLHFKLSDSAFTTLYRLQPVDG